MNTPDLRPTTHPTPFDPLAHPGCIRIIVEAGQATPFPQFGETFICVAPGSYPEAPGRTVLYAIPCPRERLHDAQLVAMGKARATKIKPQTT